MRPLSPHGVNSRVSFLGAGCLASSGSFSYFSPVIELMLFCVHLRQKALVSSPSSFDLICVHLRLSAAKSSCFFSLFIRSYLRLSAFICGKKLLFLLYLHSILSAFICVHLRSSAASQVYLVVSHTFIRGQMMNSIPWIFTLDCAPIRRMIFAARKFPIFRQVAKGKPFERP